MLRRAQRTAMTRVALVARAPGCLVAMPSLSVRPLVTATTVLHQKRPTVVRQRRPVPPPLSVSPTATKFFRALLGMKPVNTAVILRYEQSHSGQPRMVFNFGFVGTADVGKLDEKVPLGLDDGVTDDWDDDTLSPPMLYVHRGAVMKVLGATINLDAKTCLPVLHDKEGRVLEPHT